MKTSHHNSQSVITITDDQQIQLSLRINEARALIYLLGTVVQKEPHGLFNEPDSEEQDGICSLVRVVGGNLSEAFKAATSTPPEIAPESILRGGSPPLAHPCPKSAARDLHSLAHGFAAKLEEDPPAAGAESASPAPKSVKTAFAT